MISVAIYSSDDMLGSQDQSGAAPSKKRHDQCWDYVFNMCACQLGQLYMHLSAVV